MAKEHNIKVDIKQMEITKIETFLKTLQFISYNCNDKKNINSISTARNS